MPSPEELQAEADEAMAEAQRLAASYPRSAGPHAIVLALGAVGLELRAVAQTIQTELREAAWRLQREQT